MGFVSVSFSIFYSIFSALAFLLVLTLIALHIYSKFKRPAPMKLNSDSVVVIVGACMGIGKLMAIEIAKQFHPTIIIIDRKKQLFEEVSKQIKKYNGVCDCFMCDLSDLQAVDKIISTIKEQRKKIDFLLYNAGIMFPNFAWQEKQQQIHAVMNVNFFAPIKFINGLLPRLESGHIAVVASVVAIVDGAVQLSSYVSSKHAIYGYLNTLRQELKQTKKKITLSIGCPYAINTTMFQGFKTKYQKLLPVLDEKYVAQRLIKQFIDKKQICFVGRRHAFVAKLSSFLPSVITDWITINANMSDFSNRKNK